MQNGLPIVRDIIVVLDYLVNPYIRAVYIFHPHYSLD
jgi:hypothetical protein